MKVKATLELLPSVAPGRLRTKTAARTPQRQNVGVGWRDLLLLASLTAGVILVHGYHGGIEDAEIYLPGILARLDPSLFPYNTAFFASHAGLTLFPTIVAASIRLSHLPVGVAMLCWHALSVFLLLLACLKIGRLCFRGRSAAWGGVAMVASLVTIPVAGTALYIMDQYVTSRSLSTPASMLAVAAMLGGNYLSAGIWLAFTAAVHPLMALFSGALIGILFVTEQGSWSKPLLSAFVPLALFPPVTPAYREVLKSHSYFLLSNWAWDEWLGLLAPFAIFAAIGFWANYRGMRELRRLCRAAVLFESLFLAAAFFVSFPGPFERFAEIQPMRCLLLLYTLLFLFLGGLLGEYFLRNHAWRWALVFAPLCAGMAYAQIQLFPASPHVEWPWQAPRNSWAQAFDWIRVHTPHDAYFALDPDYERLPGVDEHGFRAIARRSMLADNGKDSGAVSMFPALAAKWSEQVEARRGWRQFARGDFERLKARYGVNWVVLQQPGARGLTCPYQNERALVCRID